MADFKETQRLYMESKTAYKQASASDYLARQQYHMWETRVTEFLKGASVTSLPAGHPLLAEQVEINKRNADSSAALNKAKQALTTAREAFNALGAVNTTVSNINDSIPILLLPLKIQTRFLTIKHIARNLPANALVDVNTLPPVAQQQLRRLVQDFRPTADPLRLKSSPALILSNSRQPGVDRFINELNQGDPRIRIRPQRLVKVEDEFELWVRIFPDDLFLRSHETALTSSEMDAAKV